MAKPVAFSTAAVSPADRLDFWTDKVRENLFDVSMRPFAAEGLEASCHARTHDDHSAMSFANNALMLDRTAALITSDPIDSLFLTFVIDGTALYYSGTQSEVIRAGEFLLYDPQRPYVLTFSQGFRQLFLDAPRESLVGAAGDGWTPEDTTTRRYSQSALSRTGSGPDGIHHLHDAISGSYRARQDLEGTRILGAVRRLIEPSPLAEYAAVARDFIQINFARPDLTAEEIARGTAVSSRHLNRALAPEGETILSLLTNTRMAEARRLLSSGLSITEVAHTCGYRTVGQFSRVFSSRHGEGPAVWRRTDQQTIIT